MGLFPNILGQKYMLGLYRLTPQDELYAFYGVKSFSFSFKFWIYNGLYDGLKLNVVKEPTCFKNVVSHILIKLILTNRSNSFQSTLNAETGLSDVHMMTVTVMK